MEVPIRFKEKELIYYEPQNLPKIDTPYLVLLPLSDWHTGNPYCSYKTIDYQVQCLHLPWVYGILNGDLMETVLRDSVGDIHGQKLRPKKQRDWIIKKLKPVKEKILGAVEGNHEYRISSKSDMDPTEDIALALGCPYQPDGMLLKLSFGDNNRSTPGKPYVYWVYFSHGYGGARTVGAKAQKLERMADMHADVFIQSHDHTEMAFPQSYLMPDPRTTPEKDEDGELTGFHIGKVKEHRRLFVKSGAAVKWGGYAQRGGMRPAQLGTPTITLHGMGKPWAKVEI